ncbi:pyridoxamine 5'-phosphate oxidase family protein [Candidatus Saccharibacteria bacterium]|nr:pyridoxamine 5'-phosphate oxidase family protein [Candidatus Saccharibacteria bacterium]
MNNDILQKYFIKNLYCTVATVTPQGSPWASPLYYGFDEKGILYIRSSKNAQHMVNMRHSGQAFVTIFDSSQPIGTADGLYLQCSARELDRADEITEALAIMNGRIGSNTNDPSKFMGAGPRRVVQLQPVMVWRNRAEVTPAGFIDYREELPLSIKTDLGEPRSSGPEGFYKPNSSKNDKKSQ